MEQVLINFSLPGDPVALARPRLGKWGAFDSQSAIKKIARQRLILQLRSYLNGKEKVDAIKAGLLASSCDFVVNLVFCHRIPRSLNQGQANAIHWGFKNDSNFKSLTPHQKDLDNEIKYILDVGNEILWRDDRQIIEIHAHKVYSSTPRTEIMIEPIQPRSTIANSILECFDRQGFDIIMEELLRFDAEEIDEEKFQINVAYLLSRIADTYGADLAKVAKKYPGAWSKIK